GQIAELVMQMVRQIAEQLERGVAGRLIERKPVLLTAETPRDDDQRKGLGERQIGRREEGPGSHPVPLPLLIVEDRQARVLQRLQVAKDGPATDLTELGQIFGVVNSPRLQPL